MKKKRAYALFFYVLFAFLVQKGDGECCAGRGYVGKDYVKVYYLAVVTGVFAYDRGEYVTALQQVVPFGQAVTGCKLGFAVRLD